MTILKIDDKNEIYYEFVKPKDNGFTFVFVNALTGNVSAWNGEIGQLVVGQGNGYLTYNFRGQETSKFDEINIASNMRDASQKNNSNKDVSIMDVTPASIEKFFDEHHIDLLIHGHTHRPNTHQDDTGTRIVLGDWHKTGWCLMLDEKQQELREFTL